MNVDQGEQEEDTHGDLGYAEPRGIDPNAPLTTGSVAILAVRLLGVYCLIQGAPILYQLPALAFMISNVEWRQAIMYALVSLSPAIYLGVGVLLLARSRPIAMFVLGARPSAGPDEPAPSRVDGHALQSLAFAVVGVVLFVQGMSELVLLFASGFRDSEISGRDIPSSIVQGNTPRLLAAVVRGGAGAWLFFGAKRLASYWLRVRVNDAAPPTVEADVNDAAGGGRA
jgi:hypothetical protein